MPRDTESKFLPLVLAAAVLVEFVLLRTATRTLVHIPGLGSYETPIRVVAEVGRYSYYLAVVLLVATLSMLSHRSLRRRDVRGWLIGGGTLLFLVLAGAGRMGLLSQAAVGWSSIAIIVIITATLWRGLQTLPLGLFVVGTVMAGVAVLGQGSGGGLSGRQVDLFILAAEISLIAAGVTSPLLLRSAPRSGAIVVGGIAAVLVAGALVGAGSTLSVLLLWNLGVPGWLPGLGYALAAGALAITLTSALADRQVLAAAGVLLLVAGGIGLMSTYQTALVVAGILIIGWSSPEMQAAGIASFPADSVGQPTAVTSATRWLPE